MRLFRANCVSGICFAVATVACGGGKSTGEDGSGGSGGASMGGNAGTAGSTGGASAGGAGGRAGAGGTSGMGAGGNAGSAGAAGTASCDTPASVVGRIFDLDLRRPEIFAIDADNDVVTLIEDAADYLESPDFSKVAAVRGADLFVSPTACSEPVQVSGPLAPGADGLEFSPNFFWSADASHLAYVSDHSGPGQTSLWVAASDGSRNTEVTMGFSGQDVAMSPDGARVAYVSSGEVYVAASDGSSPPVLVGPTPSGFPQLQWGSDGARIFFSDDRSGGDRGTVWSALADGSGLVAAATDVLTVVSLGRPRLAFQVAPDGAQLAYLSEKGTPGTRELYVASADGTGDTPVSGMLVAGGDVTASAWWSPDSSRLAYRADKETDGVFELFTVAPDGTGEIKISGPLVMGGDVSTHSPGGGTARGTFDWSPDSSLVAYVADQETDEILELFVANADGTQSPLKVSGAMPAEGDVAMDDQLPFAWSSDSVCLAYWADQVDDGTVDLFLSALTDGACPTDGLPAARWFPETLPGPLDLPTEAQNFGPNRDAQQRPPEDFCWVGDALFAFVTGGEIQVRGKQIGTAMISLTGSRSLEDTRCPTELFRGITY